MTNQRSGLRQCNRCGKSWDASLGEFQFCPYCGTKILSPLETAAAEGFAIRNGVLVGYHGQATEVRIPEFVTAVGEKAFYDNDKMTMLFVPESVKQIGPYAFNGCSALESVSFSEGLETIAENAFCFCKSLRTIQLPDSVHSIGQGAFSYCLKLEEIVLPANLTEISEQLFISCVSLRYVQLPMGLRTVGNSAFFACKTLNSIRFSAQLQKIEKIAFADCSNLREVVVPKTSGVTDRIFGWTEEDMKTVPLAKIVYYDPEPVTQRSASVPKAAEAQNLMRCHQCGATWDAGSQTAGAGGTRFCPKCGAMALSPLETAAMEEGFVIQNGVLVTYRGNATVVRIPEFVTVIGEEAFSENEEIEKVYLPGSVKVIEPNAFSICSALESVSFSEGLETIGKYAFYWCGSLRSIKLPESVRSIEKGAFSYCRNLEEIVLPSHLTEIEMNLFLYCDSLRSVQLPAGLRTVGDRAFNSCKSLSAIRFPAQLQKIGDCAFAECSNLREVVVPKTSEVTESIFGEDRKDEPLAKIVCFDPEPLKQRAAPAAQAPDAQDLLRCHQCGATWYVRGRTAGAGGTSSCPNCGATVPAQVQKLDLKSLVPRPRRPSVSQCRQNALGKK